MNLAAFSLDGLTHKPVAFWVGKVMLLFPSYGYRDGLLEFDS